MEFNPTHRLIRRTEMGRTPRVVFLGLVVYGLGTVAAPAQTAAPEKAIDTKATIDRKQALALSYEHRDLDALPLLEVLAKADPKDREVLERLAVALITKSVTVSAEEAAAVRKRAREILYALKRTGTVSDLGEILAEGIPDNGGVQTYSTRTEAQMAMKEGEAAFARRDFDAARRAYQRALTLDPKLYSAALFVGDTYFAEDRLAKARPWFSRAILIDPNREVGHRYLGDAFSKAGLTASARECYLDAVLAEPYIRRPWIALIAWAKANNASMGHPRVVPEGLENEEAGKAEPKKKAPAGTAVPDDGRSHWHLYAETRAAWVKDRFRAASPLNVEYRHSLAEETDALRRVARAIAADVAAGRVKTPHPCFAKLITLENQGLLESYVLYARPDEGIAQDYEAYRTNHRGELHRYLNDVFAPAKTADAAEGRRS